MSDILECLVCPECSYDFDEVDLSEDIECPDCGNDIISGHIMDRTAGVDLDDSNFGSDFPEPEVEDAEEVTEDGIKFKNDEEYYRVDKVEYTCPECGEVCDVECKQNGLREVVYCNNCDIEYSRKRDRLVDDIRSADTFAIQTAARDRDVHKTYDCSKCDMKHSYTKPTDLDKFEPPETGVTCRENAWYDCICGDSISLDRRDFDINDELVCSCDRTYKLIQLE
jgi:predicted RNA-binding Zn-ribbon protein involved in translation (DUF1610 family)